MIYHKIHICNFCDLHELCTCVSSNSLLEKMIYHKIHISNLCGLRELCVCDSLIFLVFEIFLYKYYRKLLCAVWLYYHAQFQNVSWTMFRFWRTFHICHTYVACWHSGEMWQYEPLFSQIPGHKYDISLFSYF